MISGMLPMLGTRVAAMARVRSDPNESMIRKSGNRFSEKIMLKQ
jgi:hypothetical protein